MFLRLLTIGAIALALIARAAAGPEDEAAIKRLLHTTFDRPEARLVIEPVVVAGDHALAGWSQADMGGRALLRRRGGAWSLILCSGDGIKSADALRHAGLPESDAGSLAAKLSEAEARLPKERVALFATFEGTVMMNADGSHPPVPHGQMHGAQHVQMQAAPHGQMAHDAASMSYKIGPITVDTPWLRATPHGAQVAGGYMKIINTGTTADRLVGGTLDQARRFEVHEMTMVDHVMKMRPLPNGLEIKPGETIELKPGGYHIMGVELQKGYTEGQTVKGTLQFQKAGTVNVEYAVRSIGGGGYH